MNATTAYEIAGITAIILGLVSEHFREKKKDRLAEEAKEKEAKLAMEAELEKKKVEEARLLKLEYFMDTTSETLRKQFSDNSGGFREKLNAVGDDVTGLKPLPEKVSRLEANMETVMAYTQAHNQFHMEHA